MCSLFSKGFMKYIHLYISSRLTFIVKYLFVQYNMSLYRMEVNRLQDPHYIEALGVFSECGGEIKMCSDYPT